MFKRRAARAGSGKSGGFRTIVLFRVGSHSFFVHGFSTSGKADVSAGELKALKRWADVFLEFSDERIAAAMAAGELIEVTSDDDQEKS